MPRAKQKLKPIPLNQIGKTPDEILAVFYGRVSSDSQDIDNSIASHHTRVYQWAEQSRVRIIGDYLDEGRSGRYDKRNAFNRMIEAAEAPDCPFKLIVVWKFARFFRNKMQSQIYKARLAAKGIRVISISEPMDDSPMGRFIESNIENMDAFYSENLSEEVKRGTYQLAQDGFWPGGRAPYGMKKIEVPTNRATRYKLAPDPETARHIRRLFDLALSGLTESQVTNTANEEGVPAYGGKKWEPNRVHDALTKESYAGILVWGKSGEYLDDIVIVYDAFTGIVTREEFDRVQRMLGERRHEVVNAREVASEHAFSGLVKCRLCGTTYIYKPSQGRTKRYNYLTCKTRIASRQDCCGPRLEAGMFEQLAMNAIFEGILSEKNAIKVMDMMKNQKGAALNHQKQDLEAIEKQLEQITSRKSRLLDIYLDNSIVREEYTAKAVELNEQEVRLKSSKESLLAAIDKEALALENKDLVLTHIGEVASYLRECKPVQAKAWMKRFIRHIWIEPGEGTKPGKGTIVYKLPLPEGGPFAGAKRQEFQLQEKVCPTTRLSPRKRG